MQSQIINSSVVKPQNFEEKLIWYSIIGTYGIYIIGALYVWIPALAWFFGLLVGVRLWHQTKATPVEERIQIPITIWFWIAAMLVMQLALVMAHLDFNLGPFRMVTSTLSWARTWALMALFPLAGCLKIRPQLIYRAACFLCIQSLVVALICYLITLVGVPDTSGYVTPWWYILRGDRQLYVVDPYIIDANNDGALRLNLFAPWANSLGIVGAIYFFLASQETNKKLRFLGMIGGAVMVVGSVSRMTTLCLIVVPILTWALSHFTWPMQIASGFISVVLGMFAPQIINTVNWFWESVFKGYRSGSQRIRSDLKSIAIYRWKTDAPIWGHGIVAEQGPAIVHHNPIGTHEQWSDLLFVRGLVGFLAFLLPCLWSMAELIIKAQNSRTARAGLSLFLTLMICTFGADVEMVAYLYWPGLILLGITFKEKLAIFSPTPVRQPVAHQN